MTWFLALEQALNGLQLGLVLFLVAGGLTLVLGVMDVVNLAHGAVFTAGAIVAAAVGAATGSFWLALLVAPIAAAGLGTVAERLVVRRLYDASHLLQVLATFGLILVIDEGLRLIFGAEARSLALPDWLAGRIEIVPGLPYPTYRLALIGVGLLLAAGLAWAVGATRLGAWIRAGAADRQMTQAMGIDVGHVFALVFGAGAALAGLAGALAAPLIGASVGIGSEILILALVVVVVGGLGSVRGAFAAALLIGLVDTLGRAVLPDALGLFLTPQAVGTAAPALASVIIYLTMAVVLILRPDGLLPPRGRRG